MKRIAITLTTGACALTLAVTAAAEDDPFGDTFEEGFSDVEAPAKNDATQLYVSTRLFQNGQWNTAHEAPEAGATDHRGLSSLVLGIQPRFEWRPNERFEAVYEAAVIRDWVFDLKEDAEWKDPYRDQREYRLVIDEAVLRYQTADWAVSSGRQILTWGFNDILSVQEVVNPSRMTQPGLYEPEEARRARWITEARGYLGGWTLQGVLAHESRVAELPVYGSDFYPLAFELDDNPPDHGWDDPAAHAGGLRLSGLWHGFDLATFVWHGYNPSGHLLFAPGSVSREYERTTTLGAGLSVPVSDAVIKAEIAYENGLTYAPVTQQTVNGQTLPVSGAEKETDRWSAVLGLDISLPESTRLVIEYRARYLPDYQNAMATNLGEETQVQWAFGLEHTTWRDQLTLSGAVLGFGDDFSGGQMTRLSADWAINDQWRTELGYIAYEGGEATLLEEAKDNDRVYWRIDYFF